MSAGNTSSSNIAGSNAASNAASNAGSNNGSNVPLLRNQRSNNASIAGYSNTSSNAGSRAYRRRRLIQNPRKLIGVLMTFVLLFAVSICLMFDDGSNVTAYFWLLLTILIGPVMVLIFTPFDDRQTFATVFFALTTAIALAVTPMLTFVETDMYTDGTTVTPGHSGVQTMEQGVRIGLGVLGIVELAVLLILYNYFERKQS